MEPAGILTPSLALFPSVLPCAQWKDFSQQVGRVSKEAQEERREMRQLMTHEGAGGPAHQQGDSS